ncbi:MAG TPA: TIGR03790 family protein [Tepidisphaeraceae bacterium]|nr:TIGR03790 family protein [Tepidisphaeraceae bacterium]
MKSTPRASHLVVVALSLLASAARALDAGQLLLIVNKNVPEGLEIARHYAKARAVPDGRILALDLPPGDDCSFDLYETRVLPEVRKALADPKLAGTVSCAVTFYGMPLRVLARPAAPGDAAERAGLEADLAKFVVDIEPVVASVEALARRSDPAFAPIAGSTVDHLAARAEAAARALSKRLAAVQDEQARETLAGLVAKAVDPLVGKANLAERRMAALGNDPKAAPAEIAEAEKIRTELLALRARIDDLQSRRGDPAARRELRDLARAELAPFDYGRMLIGMTNYFNATDGQAAFDNELALVGWNYYPRAKWLGNPLNHKFHGSFPTVLMTMRIDGPTPAACRALIDASVQVEKTGLTGKIVLDAGGNLQIDPSNRVYKAYDDTIRRCAELIRAKSPLAADVVLDEKKEVLPRGAVKDVALYCGWYAVRNYNAPCAFVPGAVGYHIGSFELVSLRNPGEPGWCRGLMLDGIAATLGPEAEPFLAAFPEADEFFPLLLTGKLTLAEVYWKTTPLASWRITMVGDPLYTPYKARPGLKVEDLPAALRGAVGH